MNWTAEDSACMSRALELARLGRYSTHPNPRVGCVITRNERIVSTGWHQKAGLSHAEINAINSAARELRGATAYVSLEPCDHHGLTPPCTKAIIEAGIARVVIAMPDPNPGVSGKGIKTLINAGITVETGLMAEQAHELNKGFVSRMTRQRPYLRCKSAISLDGKTALANGESQWITGAASRLDAQRLRAESSAVMTGINTVLADDPRLNVRGIDTDGRQPHRIVLDRRLRFPVSARMLQAAGKTILFTQSKDDGLYADLEKADAIVNFVDEAENGFLNAVLRELALKYEVNDLLVEAGPTLSGNLLISGLIDELIVYQAPVLLGSGATDMMMTPVVTRLSDRYKLELVDYRRIDDDWRFTFKPLAAQPTGCAPLPETRGDGEVHG